MKVLKEGDITSVQGYKANGISCGIKGGAKKDLAVIYSEEPSIAAGVYTRNLVRSKTIDITKENVKKHDIRGIVINSGNANACVGHEGYIDAMIMTETLANEIGVLKEEIGVASTGVIGKRLPMDKIIKGINDISTTLSYDGGKRACEAIMTTDKREKKIAVDVEMEDGTVVRIGAIAKGSGMIEPNMGTMLGFITSDVNITKEIFQELLKDITDRTFNMISVDGDTSTNDMVIALANKMAGNTVINSSNCVDYENFKKGLNFVMEYLAKEIARDGEGATKLLEVKVKNANSYEGAKKIGKSVIKSSLVKTAFFGEDANWGRIIASVGYSGAKIRENDIDIMIGGVYVCKNGMAALDDETEVNKELKKDEIVIVVDIKEGTSDAKVWGCDLSYDYVKINADYRS